MSKQAENFENLVRGNSVGSIVEALHMLRPDVRKELMKKHGSSDIDELAIKLQ